MFLYTILLYRDYPAAEMWPIHNSSIHIPFFRGMNNYPMIVCAPPQISDYLSELCCKATVNKFWFYRYDYSFMKCVFLICLTSFVRIDTDLPNCFWTGKSVGGCHLLQNETGLNMGFVVGPPVAVSDSTLVIRYKSGDVCNLRSSLTHYRSTTIMFHCSLQQVSLC